MDHKPLLEGEGLYKLIPQRNPVVMVDTFFCADEESAETGLHVQSGNLFCEGNVLREPGLIEHVAQSAAAFAGYAPYVRGESPKLGFIGEVKKFRIVRLPQVGEFLHTSLKVLGEAAGVTLIAAETKSEGETLATCQMKIFSKED
ncbi:MAG: hydroxymyristoyl-ACP dehydratase [Bacteroides sp.]|nr:hydroxymyristoyl-ACP dehydratase [Bacteroides sp.]